MEMSQTAPAPDAKQLMEQEAAEMMDSSRLAEFCDYTTAHGLGRFIAQVNLLGRMLWLCFLLATYVSFSYHMYTLGLQFASVPLDTTLSTALPFEFPDLYFCPSDLVTVSRLATPLDSGALIRNVKCSSSCLMDGLSFKINTTDAGQYNNISLALLDVISAAQDNITWTLQYANLTNPSICRSTSDGEDYKGNLSVVPIYHSLYIERRNVSFGTTADPYVTFNDCIGWNQAARELKISGVPLGDAILAMGYADSENTCRQPTSLPLTAFYRYATYPLMDYVGCINSSRGIAHDSCIVDEHKAMTVEMCAQCCYNKLHSYAAVHSKECQCTSTLNSSLVFYKNSLCNIRCHGGNGEKCGGEGNLMSLYSVAKIGNASLSLPFRPTLRGFNAGPYCFYRGVNNSLSATYCNVPYCAISHSYDCLQSDVNSRTTRVHYAGYTGYASATQTADKCLNWLELKSGLESGRQIFDWGSFEVARVLNVNIETGDYALFNSSKRPCPYCRSVSLVADLLVKEAGIFVYTRRLYYWDSPVCAYQNSTGFINIGFCFPPACSKTIRSLSGALTSRIGADLLLGRFGSSLGIGFSGCRIGSASCGMHDFTTVVHPELGLCHKFNQKSFPAIASGDVKATDLTLSLSYFTDSTDQVGQSFPSMAKVFSVLHTGRLETEDTKRALQVIAVPSGQYPRATDAVTVGPGQNLDLKLRYDKTTRFSKPPDKQCLADTGPVTYALPHWKTSWEYYNKTHTESFNLSAILTAKSWVEKTSLLREALTTLNNGRSAASASVTFLSATQEDCVDQFVVDQFLANCGCLPPFLPVNPRYLHQFAYCFNVTSADSIAKVERCFAKQTGLLSSYDRLARRRCPPPCERFLSTNTVWSS